MNCASTVPAPEWSHRSEVHCELTNGHAGRHRDTFDSGRVTWSWDDGGEIAITITGEGS